MNKKQGFTLIELLVVIAIIGILSSVVLASLNSARSKGSDAAVKANLANVRAQAEIFYDDAALGNGSYTGLCDNATVVAAVSAAGTAGGSAAKCTASASAWAITSPLKGGAFWCVDSTGTAESAAALQGDAVYACA